MARTLRGFTGRIAVATFAAAFALACGGGGDDGPSGPTGSIQVAVNPATLTLAQGETGQVTATLTRGGGFTGNVTLTVTGLPAGVTPTVTPAQLTGATTTATVAVAVAPTVAPGTYTATINASAQGVGSATTTYQLTVTATPNYTLAMAPATLTLEQGKSGSATVNINRTNFQGGVALALVAPPAGITGTFTPANSTTNASTLAITVGAAVPPGNYNLTIQGTATGPGVKTTTLALTVTAPAAAAYTMTVNPTTVTIAPGASGTTNIALTRTNFTGNIALSVENPPVGITGALNPAATTGNTSTLTINVGAAVAPGNYTLNLKGTAAGLTDRTAQVQVTVPAPAAGVTIAATPTALNVQQGQSGNVTIAITRTNFTGAVTLAATNLPTGVTATFNPNGTTTNTSTLTLAVAGNAAAATSNITITATGPGIPNATATVALTVTPAGSGSNAVFQFCSASETPIFFAYQDGTGAWQRVNGTTSGTTTNFAFTITQNRGGVMYVHQRSSSIAADASAVGRPINRLQSARRLMEKREAMRGTRAGRSRTYARSSFVDTYETEVLYASAAELTQLGTDQCAASQPTKTNTGTVAGVAAGQTAILSLGDAFQVFLGGVSTNPVTFDNVPFGTIDFVGSRSAQPFDVPDKLVLFRNLNVPDGGSLPSTIDFNGPASSVPATATATVTNALGDELTLMSQLTTANNATASFYFDAPSTSTTRTWVGLSPQVMVAGDVHGLFLLAGPANSSSSDGRFMFKFVGAVANQTLALGPNLTAAAATQLAAGAYPRFRFQGTLPAEYQKAVFIDVSPTGGTGNQLFITATGAYLAAAGSASAYDLSMPDVAGLAGFPAASRLTAGTNEAGTTAYGWTGTGIIFVRPEVGFEMKLATKSTNITVP